MAASFLASEPAIRVSVFGGVLVIMLLWEHLAPRRPPVAGQGVRRINNLAMTALSTLLVRLLFPVLAVGAALWARSQGIGMLNWLAAPDWLAVPAAIVLLDLAIYGQHRLLHAVPLLWRLHRMHHADPDFDATTALRFHPLEIALSMLIKLAVVVALGAPALAVLLFEIGLNAMAMFNHGNVALPAALDRRLRRLIVTPDMHRVHHSALPSEMQRNFGFNLSLWDRWFGTWQDQPQQGHTAMEIGVPAFARGRDQWLDRLLLQPLKPD